MSAPENLPPLPRHPWPERLSWWVERTFARVEMGLSFNLTRWHFAVWVYSCGWLENRVDAVVGPVGFTIRYFRDPAAARLQPIFWFERPRNQRESTSGNARKGRNRHDRPQ